MLCRARVSLAMHAAAQVASRGGSVLVLCAPTAFDERAWLALGTLPAGVTNRRMVKPTELDSAALKHVAIKYVSSFASLSMVLHVAAAVPPGEVPPDLIVVMEFSAIVGASELLERQAIATAGLLREAAATRWKDLWSDELVAVSAEPTTCGPLGQSRETRSRVLAGVLEPARGFGPPGSGKMLPLVSSREAALLVTEGARDDRFVEYLGWCLPVRASLRSCDKGGGGGAEMEMCVGLPGEDGLCYGMEVLGDCILVCE
jgi:hypothetical protein